MSDTLRRKKGQSPYELVDTNAPGGCWLWLGSRNSHGYGRLRLRAPDGTHPFHRAHRWFYEQEVGPIPPGLDLDHLCEVKTCVNPAHLEPVTTLENTRRWNRRHRPAAAEFTDEEVRELRERRRRGESVAALSRETGASYKCVSRAVRGLSYRWVT